jgi:hypothetical protein
VALKSDAAAERSKDQLSRDFLGLFDHRLLQQYLPNPDIPLLGKIGSGAVFHPC